MASIERARLLIEQDRYEPAEQELRGVLLDEPGHAEAHSLLAICLAQRKQYAEATSEAELAVHASPDDGDMHRVLGYVLLQRNRFEPAEQSLRQAIALNPRDAASFGLLSHLRMHQRRWQEAADLAEAGLEADPDNTQCANLRTVALERLGKVDEALRGGAETLRRAPDDSYAHAAQGWTYLSASQYQMAQESFAEALRLDPQNELARDGMINALHSRSLLFRILFKYYNLMGRLSSGAQWGVIIGFIVAQRVLRMVARDNPQWQPVVIPILVLFFAFIILTWIIHPLFNTFLRFNHYGRYLLSKDQVRASNFIAGMAIFGLLACLITGALVGWTYGLLWLGYAIFMLLPLAGTFSCPAGWPRNVMACVTVVLAAIGAWALVSPLVTGAVATAAVVGFLLGNFGSQLLANILRGQVVRQ